MSSCTITCSLFVKLQLRTNKRNDYFGLLYTLVLTSSTSLSTLTTLLVIPLVEEE